MEPSAQTDSGQQFLTIRDELATAQAPGARTAGRLDHPQRPAARKASIRCRFYATQKGCRAGDACPYLHDASARVSASVPQEHLSSTASAEASAAAISDIASTVRNLSIDNAKPAPVSRPVSKVENQNPREFQVNQVRRRFRPKEEQNDAGTTLTFGLVPSDPDFPFELEKLHCVLRIPLKYPVSGRPTLQVTNPEMDRSFQENVERGFDDIVDSSIRTNSRGTLLSWINSLDRHLERLLTTVERAPTLKFVANFSSRDVPETKPVVQAQLPPRQIQARAQPIPQPPTASFFKNHRQYTADEKAAAEQRRNAEMRQIEARLGRQPLFQKASDGRSFVIPIQPSKVTRLPVPLRSIKTIRLGVPQLYPLEHSSIELQGVDPEAARSVEAGFAEWVGDNIIQLNLMSQINYLASNMHNFANRPTETTVQAPSMTLEQPTEVQAPEESLEKPVSADPGDASDDRSHIHVIPRPPEWSVQETGSDGEEITDDSMTDEEFTDDDTESGGAPVLEIPQPSTGRGVALSFPYLELYGIEILELVNVYITVKCERCKELLDVKNIHQAKGVNDFSALRVETCKKCTNSMSIGFRRELMHPTANRAGYLDLDGCTVVDLLPSQFTPTCAECSSIFPGQGVTAVRGESATANCRECHRRMVFKIPEVKFLIVGAAAATSRATAPARKKPKEVLGIVAGQELPRRGRCTHYAKSYRWFRFGCCAKVFPCDKCHDLATDHPNEHANRMICGFCSREQTYRPENCGVCHAVLVGKAGSGFWEGGKGTRNPRKYKRRGGTAPGGSSNCKR
ncbi:hypothetical protein ASPZODRAFT_153137 [Penicilliopsis zonata CBS 506.65]|uniref:CHY-type domain-containing protein n=1 Tax=Penicilliopsis zonata CBS 506.65 TaxID=1073090 RepID=A0A1L9SEE6_9EURO|nr:hypothetical protein ASPZODRAFT_153137 [Penicilliopsis zonata CBS 506.65]OJJ45488.1 hypothetical protein ASPZODRAFT_153137 [Penicilliopsis zonata CBS 506.65]